MSKTEKITVTVPLGATPCEICRSVTVDLDGNLVACGAHKFCPTCTEDFKPSFDGPQYCDKHRCHAWYGRRHSCRLAKDHPGQHEAWGVHPRFHWM